MLQLVCNLCAGFNGINTVTALHRTAKLLEPADKLSVLDHPGYPLLLKLTSAHAPALAARGAASGLWALARLPAAPQLQLIHAMTASLQRTLPAMDSQGLANSIWALAHIQHTPGSDVLRNIARRAAVVFADTQDQVSEGDGSSCSTVDDLLPHTDMGAVQACKPQHVSNTLWAFARLGVDPGQDMMEAAAHQLLRCAKAAKTQEIANSMWACAKLGYTPEDECLHALATQFCQQAHKASPQDLSNLMWAYAELSWAPPCIVTDTMLTTMQCCMAQAIPQDSANVVWACVKLDVTARRSFLASSNKQHASCTSCLHNPEHLQPALVMCTLELLPWSGLCEGSDRPGAASHA